MAQDMAFFQQNSNLPAHLQGVNLGVTTALMQGIFSGGNRISVKGSRFRLVVNGNEERVVEENYIDVILVAAAPAVSRRFYKGTYVPGADQAPPTCYSADGIAPPDDVKQKQSDKCMTCPQNVKGSKVVDGYAAKACAYFRRLVAILPDDDRRTVFAFDANAMSLFGDSTATAKNLNDYIKMLATRGVDAGHIVTRMSFDTDSSVPKVLFKPQQFVTPAQLTTVQEMVGSDEVVNAAQVNMSTIDISTETSSVEDSETAPAQQAAQKPAQAAPAKAVQAQPAAARPRPAPAKQPVVEDIPAPEAVQTAAPTPVEVSDDSTLADILSGLDL